MANVIVGLVILGIVGLSIAKIVSEKKKGVKCIGCPYAGSKNDCNTNAVQIELK